MKCHTATSLGIDIAGREINAVLLRRTHEGVRVLAAACSLLPEEAVEGGRIVDPAALLKALRSVKECRRRQTHTVMSLPPATMVTRVVPLLQEDPQGIARFVQEEIGQYAAFSGRKTASDYRILTAARRNASGKVAIAAADGEAVEALARTARSVGIEAKAIEPAILACARVYHASRSHSAIGSNVLLALLKGGVLTLAVLHKDVLDFTRTRALGSADADPVARHNRVADEINVVLQFYAVRGTTLRGVVLIDDESDLTAEGAEEAIRSKVASETVEIWTRGNLADFVPIEPGLDGKGSITALGLAMRSLVDEPKTAGVNLLPREADRVTVVQRNIVGTAIAFAALLLVVIVATGGMRWMAGHTVREVAAMDRAQLDRGDCSLPVAVEELSAIEAQIAVVSGELECLTQVAGSHLHVDWVQLLNDIRAAVPKRARLTKLIVEGTSVMQVEGVSESDEAVAALVSMLNRSAVIAQAELVHAGPYNGEDGAIRYSIACTLASEEIR